MNKEQLIELGLTEEQADKVVEGFGKMIPKSRFDDKNEEVKDLRQQLTDRDVQLRDLEQKATGNEDLQKQIQTLRDQNKATVADYEEKLKQKDFDFKLESALRDAKSKNPKAVKALLNMENIKLDGDKLLGLDEQLEGLKKSDDYLFVSDGLKGKTPHQGGSGGANTLTKEQFQAMTYTEKVNLYNENKELYEKLSE